MALAALCLALTAAGCTHRDDEPTTPSINTDTPTYRSSTNSDEMNSAPKYTQSGVNGGEPATLPSVPTPDGFHQNNPLAVSVYSALHNDQHIDSRYISVFSKGSTVRLLGTVTKADFPAMRKDVKAVPGVGVVLNELQQK
jgi:hypothetical protein